MSTKVLILPFQTITTSFSPLWTSSFWPLPILYYQFLSDTDKKEHNFNHKNSSEQFPPEHELFSFHMCADITGDLVMYMLNDFYTSNCKEEHVKANSNCIKWGTLLHKFPTCRRIKKYFTRDNVNYLVVNCFRYMYIRLSFDVRFT